MKGRSIYFFIFKCVAQNIKISTRYRTKITGNNSETFFKEFQVTVRNVDKKFFMIYLILLL